MESTIAIAPASISIPADRSERPAILSARARRRLMALVIVLGWFAFVSVFTSLVREKERITTASAYQQCVRR